MQNLDVALGDRSYPIRIGGGLLQAPELIREVLPQARAAIVTNETVGPLYLTTVADGLRQAGVKVTEIVLPDGEQYKDWPTLNRVFDVLLA